MTGHSRSTQSSHPITASRTISRISITQPDPSESADCSLSAPSAKREYSCTPSPHLRRARSPSASLRMLRSWQRVKLGQPLEASHLKPRAQSMVHAQIVARTSLVGQGSRHHTAHMRGQPYALTQPTPRSRAHRGTSPRKRAARGAAPRTKSVVGSGRKVSNTASRVNGMCMRVPPQHPPAICRAVRPHTARPCAAVWACVARGPAV